MKTINLVVCENFIGEYEHAVRALGVEGVQVSAYPCLCCTLKHKPVAVSFLKQQAHLDAHNVLFCGCGCEMLKLIKPADFSMVKTQSYCFSHLVSDAMMQFLIEHRGYVFNSNWLDHWSKRLEQQGFDQTLAQRFYQEHFEKLYYLNALPQENDDQRCQAFSNYVGVPYVNVPCDLGMLILILKSILIELNLIEERESHKAQLEALQVKRAEYAAMIHLMNRIAGSLSIEAAIEKIKSTFMLLFGSQRVEFVYSETLCDDPEYCKNKRLEVEQAIFSLLASDQAIIEDIVYEGTSYGTLYAYDFMFPQYIQQYREFIVEMSKVFGLLLSNIHKNQQIVNAEIAEKAARNSSEAKSRFLANMAHEIRTPLNGLMGFLQILETTELTEEQKEYLSTTIGASESLLHLINDILDYSKIEADKLRLEDTEFDIRELVRETTHLYMASIKRKHLTIETQLDPRLPQKLIGDGFRLKQILTNLLSNAIKFTEFGGIEVHVFIEQLLSADRIRVTFEIKDTGIGMCEEALQMIFEGFTQVDISTTRKYGGTGLGLAICKHLVEAMNGSITVTSTPQMGSTFSFVIETGYIRTDFEPNQSVEDRLMLVLDEDQVNVALIKAYLIQKPYRIVSCTKISEVFSYIHLGEQPIVLIESDWPEYNVLEVVDSIKNLGEQMNADIRVLILTSKDKPFEWDCDINTKVDGLLEKPVDPEKLFTLLRPKD